MDRHERYLGIITPNLQRYEATKAATWQDAIALGNCPFCGAGPFVVPAHHTNRIHGVDRLALRDMLGLGVDESICDPSYSAGRSQHTTQLVKSGKLGGSPHLSGSRRVTQAKRRSVEPLAAAFKARRTSPEFSARQSAGLAEWNERRRSRDADRRAEVIRQLLETSDSTRSIAESTGYGPTTIKRLARQHGIDLLARAAALVTPSMPSTPTPPPQEPQA